MQIQKVLIETKTYEGLYEIAINATPQISFFGNRYVTVKDSNGVDYDGELPINAIALLLFEMNDLDSNEKFKEKATKIIDDFYDRSDRLVNNVNFITYCLAIIRHLCRVSNEGYPGIHSDI